VESGKKISIGCWVVGKEGEKKKPPKRNGVWVSKCLPCSWGLHLC